MLARSSLASFSRSIKYLLAWARARRKRFKKSGLSWSIFRFTAAPFWMLANLSVDVSRIFMLNLSRAICAYGGLIAANHVYNVVKPDGLTIGNWIGGLIIQQYLNDKGVSFDAQKFEWVGSPVRINNICAFSKKSGITPSKI